MLGCGFVGTPRQFANTKAELLDNTSLEAIGKATNTSPTTSPTTFNDNHNSDSDDTSLEGGGSVPPANPKPDAPLSSVVELLSDEELNKWHSCLNACQTSDDATDFFTALGALSKEQRNQFESSVPEDTWAWLWNLPEAKEQQPLESEPESKPALALPESVTMVNEPQKETQPTVEELLAVLLACDSLVQLNSLKCKHNKTIAKAYNSMSKSEQAHVDAIAALAVPYKVYKYLGDTIVQGTSQLLQGTLVYIDPHTIVRSTASSAPVWTINGVSSGWSRPIQVSLSLLQEVSKAVLPNSEHDGGQQLGLI